MIAGLARFVSELRQAGLAVSPAEWIEAVHAVEAVGIADREPFRLALRCTLAKRARQLPQFDLAFERFFAAPGRRGREGERKTDGLSTSGRGVLQGDRTALKASPAAQAAQIGRLLGFAREGAPRETGRLRKLVLETRGGESKKAGDRSAAQDPRQRDLKRRLDATEEREIAAQVPRVVEELRLRTSRRARRSSRGRLYLRRVFRENLSHGGVPFVLPRRQRRRRRARIVLLIDVSWSTAQAAGLFLTVAREVLRRARDTRILFFVDRAVDATSAVERWLARNLSEPTSFARLVAALPGLNLDAPSDYGRAFHALLRSPRRPAGRDTLLLVLGDGRTNRFDPQDWAFEEIAERCGAVLWLVPEALAQWGTGDSALGSYLAHADVAVEARDLDGLARGVGELARRL